MLSPQKHMSPFDVDVGHRCRLQGDRSLHQRDTRGSDGAHTGRHLLSPRQRSSRAAHRRQGRHSRARHDGRREEGFGATFLRAFDVPPNPRARSRPPPPWWPASSASAYEIRPRLEGHARCFSARPAVGFASSIIAALEGAQVTLVAHRGVDRVIVGEISEQRFGVDLIPKSGETPSRRRRSSPTRR